MGQMMELANKLDDVLRDLLPPGTRAALINYPNHHNVGDPALYLGTLRALDRVKVKVTYRCQHNTYSQNALARELDRGTNVILINGGGNLGDQYQQQTARERVLSDFPDVQTIQLSQSIWFQRPENLKAFAHLVRRHKALTVLLRDEVSLETSMSLLGADSRLCPDMAFGLGHLERPVSPSTDIVWLKRRDRESADQENGPPSDTDTPQPIDWVTAPPEEAVGGRGGAALLRANSWLSARVGRHSSLWRPLATTFQPLAARRVQFGCRMLSAGRVVVTDRLHGVVLSVLMGIPVVAVDDANQKVSRFLSSWPVLATAVQLAPDHQAGLGMARRIVDAMG
jgi:exopolysaccharide biosynthesis predicted pyruvyltransferase EpsI